MEIYAELTKKQYRKILGDEIEICIPFGTSMENVAGSRGLHFECSDYIVAKQLIDGLEASGIAWQDNDDEREDAIRKQKEKEANAKKPKYRVS